MKKGNLSSKAALFFDKIEKLSGAQRILICTLTFAAIIGLFVYFLFMPKFERINALSAEYEELQNKLAKVKLEAGKLQDYQNELKNVESEFFVVMRALPDKQEIPTLLTSISEAGQESGLQFLLWQQGSESPKEFYAEIPVSIVVNGNYHNVAMFYDKVSRLPRVVNIRDIKMSLPAKSEKLQTVCTAVTYKFIESPPAPEKKKGEKKK